MIHPREVEIDDVRGEQGGENMGKIASPLHFSNCASVAREKKEENYPGDKLLCKQISCTIFTFLTYIRHIIPLLALLIG